jgi:hypothetical protein
MFKVASLTLWTSGNTLVQANFTIGLGQLGSPITTLMSFSNVVAAAIPSSTFTVPASCAGCLQTPPPFQPAGQCPNNPPLGCTCAATSGLSFCNQINYPVPSGIASDPAFQDSFVSTAYSASIALMPGASSTCQV